MDRLRTSVVVVLAALAMGAAACSGGAATGGTSDVVVALPFSSGEHLQYVLIEAGETLGRGTLTATLEEGGLWTLEQRYESETSATTDVSRASVDMRLQPRSSDRTLTGSDGTAEQYALSYDLGAERFTSTVTKDGDPDETEFRLREHAYDNESSLWLWRTLDLDEAYQARYVSVNPLERTQQTVDLLVTERVMVEVPAGEFEVWRLQVRNGRATRVVWIEVKAPHRVIQWDNGAALMQLVSGD